MVVYALLCADFDGFETEALCPGYLINETLVITDQTHRYVHI